MDEKISLVKLFEKVVSVESKAASAHRRIDDVEGIIRDDLKEIKDELKEVVAWMNRGKGWAAASLVLSSAGGGVIATLLSLLFTHKG